MTESTVLPMSSLPYANALAWLRRGSRKEFPLLLALLLVIAVFSALSDNFFTLRNLSTVLGQASLALIAGAGLTLVLISGEVDVSIGSLLAAVAIPLVSLMNATGSLTIGIMGALALGLLVGLLNGYLAAYLGINSLIVSLGTLFVLRGGVYLYTGQRAIPDEAQLEAFFELGNARLFGLLPYPALAALLVLLGVAYVLRQRRFGRLIYAVGGNAEVTRLAGYDVRRIRLLCFVLCALLATVSGILLASRLGSAVHVAGQGFEFQVVAAVVLGGVSMAGGVGSIWGMALGVLILAFLSNGLGMLNVATEWQLVVTGLVILAAVGLDMKRKA